MVPPPDCEVANKKLRRFFATFPMPAQGLGRKEGRGTLTCLKSVPRSDTRKERHTERATAERPHAKSDRGSAEIIFSRTHPIFLRKKACFAELFSRKSAKNPFFPAKTAVFAGKSAFFAIFAKTERPNHGKSVPKSVLESSEERPPCKERPRSVPRKERLFSKELRRPENDGTLQGSLFKQVKVGIFIKFS